MTIIHKYYSDTISYKTINKGFMKMKITVNGIQLRQFSLLNIQKCFFMKITLFTSF